MATVDTSTLDVEAALRASGLRVTRPRLAVIAALEQSPHADADTVAELARAELGAVSIQAVYDVLRALTDAGLVRRIEPAGSPARYELRVGDNHHHVVCRCAVRSPTSTARWGTDPASPHPKPTASSSTRPKSRTGVCAPPAPRPGRKRMSDHEQPDAEVGEMNEPEEAAGACPVAHEPSAPDRR